MKQEVTVDHCAALLTYASSTNRRPLALLATLGVLTAVSTGCRNGLSVELLGPWIGRPDVAARRREREEAKYADVLADASVSPALNDGPRDAPSPAANRAPKTDWEQFDVTVRMRFQSDRSVEMSLGEGSQPLVAEWTIVDSGPAGAIMELVTQQETPIDAPPAGDPSSLPPIRRRFELLLDRRDGELVGFAMSELGADRMLGTLYFTRPDSD